MMKDSTRRSGRPAGIPAPGRPDTGGKAFSAGVDVADHTAERITEMMDEFYALFKNIFDIRVPTVAVVDGAALGGGCEVAIACDMIVASERSKFGQPEIKVGVFPPVAAAIMPRLIGRNRTLEFLMNGETMSVRGSERIGREPGVPGRGFHGIRRRVCLPPDVPEQGHPEMTKHAVDAGLQARCMEAMESAEQLMGEMMKTHDTAEGLKAFLEKRPPVGASMTAEGGARTLDERLKEYEAIIDDLTFPTVKKWKRIAPGKVVGCSRVHP